MQQCEIWKFILHRVKMCYTHCCNCNWTPWEWLCVCVISMDALIEWTLFSIQCNAINSILYRTFFPNFWKHTHALDRRKGFSESKRDFNICSILYFILSPKVCWNGFEFSINFCSFSTIKAQAEYKRVCAQIQFPWNNTKRGEFDVRKGSVNLLQLEFAVLNVKSHWTRPRL